MAAGRYAPSPSGDLHLGNLRTALLAWLFARSTGRAFMMRIDDLDRVREGAEQRQLDDLRALGIDWDGPEVHQSDHLDRYEDALAELDSRGLTYPCFCSRREIREAASAPHGTPSGGYPGTCRQLSRAERRARAAERPAALRLRAGQATHQIHDALHGDVEGAVDNLVLRRNDQTPAYHLTTVVDDDAMGVDQVVRGDDLLSSAPPQAHLASLLGLAVPTFAHVPLALNSGGVRLAKRDGTVTRADLAALNLDAFALIVESLRMEGNSARELLRSFDPAAIPRDPWVFAAPASPA